MTTELDKKSSAADAPSGRKRRSRVEPCVPSEKAPGRVRKPITRRSLRLELKRVVACELPAVREMTISNLRGTSVQGKVDREPRLQRSSPGTQQGRTQFVCHKLSDVSSNPSEELEVDTEEDTDSSLEVFPVPSTWQEKEARRLARQRQLQEMRARELAESRKMRILRRQQGLSVPHPVPRERRVMWADKEKLVRIHIYSPLTEIMT